MSTPLNTQALQKVDRWIGIPVCWILTALRRLTGIFRARASATARPRKLLFVKFAEQGSTVLAFPAISTAVEMVGRENVYFIVFEENRFILDLMDIIPRENVVTIRHKSAFNMVVQALAALIQIHKLGIDSAVDLEFFSRSSAALTFLTGARIRAGFHTFFGEGPYRGDLMTHRLLYNPYLHTSQIFQLMIAALEQPADALPTFPIQPPRIKQWLPTFAPANKEREEVRGILHRETEAAGAPLEEGGRIILLNPNASDLLPLRKWATDRYIQLAKRLLERFPDAWIGLTGGPDESATVQRVAEQIGSPRCVSLAGKTTLRQLLVLYSLCELLITNDSGPAHFASMTSISVITLFGPETPSLFGARSPRNTAIWMGIACSPCVNAYNNRQSPCTNNVCMQQITIEHVFESACQAIQAREKANPKANVLVA